MNIKNFFLRSVLSSIDHMPNYEITIVLISFLSPLMVSNSPLVGSVWCTTSIIVVGCLLGFRENFREPCDIVLDSKDWDILIFRQHTEVKAMMYATLDNVTYNFFVDTLWSRMRKLHMWLPGIKLSRGRPKIAVEIFKAPQASVWLIRMNYPSEVIRVPSSDHVRHLKSAVRFS